MRESDLQETVAQYIRLQYPWALFHSDFGLGVKLTPSQAVRQKRQNGGRRGWPDMFIAEPKVGKDREGRVIGMNYYGLFLELKREGTTIYKKSDGQLVKDKHIREQAEALSDLSKRGYMAEFACGFDEAKRIIDDYLRGGEHEAVEF